VGNFDELEVGSDEVLVGGNEAKTLEICGNEGFSRIGATEKDVVEAGTIRVLLDA
jgi:hypothetical protein